MDIIGFLTYLWELLCTAFWNPDSLALSLFGWGTTLFALYTIVVREIPKMAEWVGKKMSWINNYRKHILICLVIATFAVSAYSLNYKLTEQLKDYYILENRVSTLERETINSHKGKATIWVDMVCTPMAGQNRLGRSDGFPPCSVVPVPALRTIQVTGSQVMSEAA